MHARFLVLVVLALPGCTAFSAVRSAEVTPGRSVDVGVTYTTPPGDAAAWFWTPDCAYVCDRAIPSVDISFTRGIVSEEPGRAYEYGAGLSGFFPYAHGYVQLRRGSYPFGVGGRVGLSPAGWHEFAVFARQDIELAPEARLLLSPTLFRHAGNSPNGQNPGAFTALAQGVGLELGVGRTSITPSVLAVWGRVDRRNYGRRIEDTTTFLVLGMTVGFGR